MTPEQEQQATCPHPPEYLHPAEGWLLGRFLRVIRCRLCGATPAATTQGANR
jgi:hypothetical protein